jgi:hypothetical protein
MSLDVGRTTAASGHTGDKVWGSTQAIDQVRIVAFDHTVHVQCQS